MRRGQRKPIAGLVLTLLVASGARAATTVTLLKDNAPVAGEVCRFAALHPENPFHRWLASQELVCAPSGKLELPAGLWNVFGRSADGISRPVLVERTTEPASLDLTLIGGAKLDVSLPPRTTGVLYAPRSLAAYPVQQTQVAPAEEELWLIVLSEGSPVNIVKVLPAAAGSERKVAAQASGTPGIFGWISVPEADRAALAKARGMLAPKLVWKGEGKERTGDLPAPAEALHGSFYAVSGAAGSGTLEASGQGWLPYARAMTAAPQQLTLVRDPLPLRASATLVVNWSTFGDLEALDRTLGSCDPRSETAPFEIVVSSCAAPKTRNERVDAATCRPIRKEPLSLPNAYGTVTIGEVPPGHYSVQLRYGKLPPYSELAEVGPLQQRPVFLQGRWFEAYGNLTRGGDALPEDSRLELPGGAGFSRARSGEYRAVLTRLLGVDARVDVSECRGGAAAFVLTNAPLRPGARLDLDIPANELAITVVDTFTRMPLPSPSARLTLISLSLPKRPVHTRDLSVTVGEGERDEARAHERRPHFVMRGVPEREVRLTVSHAGYQKQNLDPFTMPKSERRVLEVQLVPLRGTSARIVSPKPFEGAMVFWYAQSGEEVERADVAADGTLFFELAHGAGETMAVVSRSHPLWIARSPAFGRREGTEIRFPDVPSRTAEVSVATADRRYTALIGAAIGGLRVPTPVMAQHLALRDSSAVLRAPGPLVIPDLAESGPIEIILGPPTERAAAAGRNFDLLALPQYSDRPRRRLQPGENSVLFEAK